MITKTMVSSSPFSLQTTSRYNVRSKSFPARLHPSTLKVEEELHKLRSLHSPDSSDTKKLLVGLSSLEKLYMSLEDFLNMPSTRVALAQTRHQKWLEDLIETSLNFLDTCGRAMDAILLLKGSVRELQSVLRRSKVGETDIKGNFNEYINLRKRMRKEIIRCVGNLKQRNDRDIKISELDDHIIDVVRVLNEANSVTNSIFCSISRFLASPISKKGSSKWSLVSKIMLRGVMACSDHRHELNELESVDFELGNILEFGSSTNDVEAKIHNAKTKLEDLDGCIEGFERGFECLFRHLIHTRVGLLNIISC